MIDMKIESIQKEITLNIQGESVPLMINLSILKDEKGQEIGKVLVFDDLSPIVNAQRAAFRYAGIQKGSAWGRVGFLSR